MSLTSIMAEDRRLAIVLTLNEASGFELNEDTLRLALRAMAHNVTHDQLRGDLTWLRDQGMLRIQIMPVTSGDLWIAHLLAAGQDVAGGAVCPGIARPTAR